MMTPLEWFAFVILPATLAVVAIGASRLFDRLHPIPKGPETVITDEQLRAIVQQAVRATSETGAADDRPRPRPMVATPPAR